MTFEHTRKHLQAYLDNKIPGNDLLIYQHGREIFRQYQGVSDLEKMTPMNGKERAFIFSCSKPITVVCAMQLFEKGSFKLEDRLADYMPEFSSMTFRDADGNIQPAKNAITVEQLFSMTAGFSYNLTSPSLLRAKEETAGRSPTREVMRYLAQEPLEFEPGTGWNYSLCHDVLAALVEVISGTPFNDYVKEHVFMPLGMKNSTFITPEQEIPSLAALYSMDEQNNIIPARNNFIIGSEYASGGAGCVSSVEDYILFLEAIRQGDIILKSETIRLMETPRLTPEQNRMFWLDNMYGYGLGIRCPLPGNCRRDAGWSGAAGAYLAVDREHDLTFFYLQNVLNHGDTPPRKDLILAIYADLGI